MTVTRQGFTTFTADRNTVLNAVEQALSENALYKRTTVNHPASQALTVISPGFPLLSTKMSITVRTGATPDQTRVEAMTTSQWYIIGDIFRMYDRYIADFFSALNTTLGAVLGAQRR